MPKFWPFGSKFSKTNDKFEISTFKISYMQSFVKIRKLILFGQKCQNLGIWAQNLKNEASRKFKISAILKFLVVSGRFAIFFRVVLAGFGSFRLASGRFG